MSNSFEMADFFFTRVQQSIAYKQYIRTVSIKYTHAESFGNEYIRVSYTINAHDNFKNVSLNKRESVFKGSSNHTFSLSTAQAPLALEEKLLKVLEFKHIYESLTANAILQLEKGLDPGTPINVSGIDFWPWTNYAEKYLLMALQKKHKEFSLNNLESDIWQWKKLHQLSKQSEKIYATEKKSFSVKDTMLTDPFGEDFIGLRSVLIDYQVPVYVKGIKTIDEVRIHTARLVEALKKEIRTDSNLSIDRKAFYQRLIIYLYNYHLPSEKEKIIALQKKIFLNHFMVQQGDVVELIDKRIVLVNSVSVEKENDLCFEYTIIKNNLQLSARNRTVSMDNAAYVLKGDEFMQYPNSYIKSLPVLSKWMKKRKMKITSPLFAPDLLHSELTNGE